MLREALVSSLLGENCLQREGEREREREREKVHIFWLSQRAMRICTCAHFGGSFEWGSSVTFYLKTGVNSFLLIFFFPFKSCMVMAIISCSIVCKKGMII